MEPVLCQASFAALQWISEVEVLEPISQMRKWRLRQAKPPGKLVSSQPGSLWAASEAGFYQPTY